MTREEKIELLEKERVYMLSHGGDRQAVALDSAIKALEQEPCEDTISREDALMALTGEWTEITDEIIHRFIKRIKALPPVNSQPEWIDVGKRLPEKYGEYLITWTTSQSKRPFIGISEGEVTGEYDHEHNRFKFEWLLEDYIKAYPNVEVIAWMPLPTLYVPETNIGKMSEIPTGSESEE